MWFFVIAAFLCVCLHYPALIPLRRKSKSKMPSVKKAIPALISASPSHHPRSSSNLSELLSLAPSSQRPSSYLHGFCAMIPHRGTLFLVKIRPMTRRLSASRFVAPTGLRNLPRLRPHPRLDLHSRRARYGFPSPVASFRSCPLFSREVRSSASQRSSAFKHRSSPTNVSGIFPAFVHILVSVFVRVGLATASLHRSPPFGLAPL